MSNNEGVSSIPDTVSQIQAASLPLGGPPDLDPLLDRVGDALIVAIGEGTHGTHEFQDTRAELTRRLIAEHGFTHVAIEGDWPDGVAVDRSVRHVSGAPTDPGDVLYQQQHWPSWMGANTETVDFTRWLREYNDGRPPEHRVGWHGLDVYPLWAATRGVMRYLTSELRWSPSQANDALDAPLRGEPMVPEEQIDVIAERLASTLANMAPMASAAAYYRAQLRGGIEAMNARSEHWLQTLDQYGAAARTVLWAHNTHVGDARGTSMAADGFVSIGQLVRERYGQENVALVGFTGGDGMVMAAHERGAAMDTITVPEPRSDSVEALLSEATGDESALFVFPEQRTGWLVTQMAHRTIGAVYYPDRDDLFYVPTRLGLRYDALCWYPHSTPVQALHLEAARRGELETLRVPE
jgi:erythromycin esterase